MRLILTTCSSQQAEELAAQLLAERLIGCANLMPQVRSLYHWQGELCREEECLLLMETTVGLIDRATERLRELHSYEVPKIVTLNPETCDSDYLRWLQEVTRSTPASSPRKLHDIDWENWGPVDRATLTFVIRGQEVLLIRKKRGLGAGKINGPGGKIEKGESTLDGAIREVEEEVGITPLDAKKSGELRFQFTDGYSIHVHVFTARNHRGEARESDEAIPLWTNVQSIPYSEMWADDILWLPAALDGKAISGRFLFENDVMLDYELD